AGTGKANQALTAQIMAAVKAGDKTSFDAAYKAIVSAMSGPNDGQNLKALNDLNTLSTQTQWKGDAGPGVIAENIQHAADALSTSDWQKVSDPNDIATFINDFNSGKNALTLKD